MLFKHIARSYDMAKRRLEISVRKLMLDMIDETINNRLQNGTFVVSEEPDIFDSSMKLKWTNDTN